MVYKSGCLSRLLQSPSRSLNQCTRTWATKRGYASRSRTQTSQRLKDKVAIVTGASSGLGRAIALRYAQEGAHVVCADLRPLAQSAIGIQASKATHELVKEQDGVRSLAVKVDVSDSQSVQDMVQAAVKEFGRVDIMCNNAGIAFETKAPQPLGIWETPDEQFDITQQVNLRGVFLGCKYAGAQMLKQEPHSSGDRGWIINTGSILGLVGTYGTSSYSAAKGGVVNLTRAAALDFAPYRIHCNTICPGYTHSAMIEGLNKDIISKVSAMHPLKGFGQPEDIARVAVFFASEDANWVTGVSMAVDGGYTAQ